MARRRSSPLFAGVLILAAVYLLYLAVPNVRPAVRAARADGTPGVFTARRLSCVRHPGHESCSWTGEFHSDDGRIHRTRVALHGSDRKSLRSGTRIAAIDVGRARQVYGPEGSTEWLPTALLLLAGVAIVVYLAVRRPIWQVQRLGPLGHGVAGHVRTPTWRAGRRPGARRSSSPGSPR